MLRRTTQPKSSLTVNSVKLLEKSPEFINFEAVKKQGDSFRYMWIFGFLGLCGLLYADLMAHLTGRSLARFTPVGGIIAILPQVAWPFMLLLGLYFSSWMQTSAWASTYDERGAIVTVAISHLLASAMLTFTPLWFMQQPPLVTRASLSDPLPVLVPFIATLPVGFLLFYARFSGFWKRKHITRSPYFVQAPLQMLVTLGWWTFVALVFEEWRRSDKVTTFTGSIREVVVLHTSSYEQLWADVSAAIAAMPSVYNVVVMYAWALGVSTLLVAPFRGMSIMPSERSVWFFLFSCTLAAAAWLYQTDQLTSVPAAVCAAVVTALLVRGYEVDG